jgi:Tfp pilus assembly protein PilW
MSRRNKGLTLIEVLVASFILILLIWAVFMCLISLQRQYEAEILRTSTLLRMQECLDRMSKDMRESNNGLIRLATFNDANFTAGPQTVVVMPTGRSTANGSFIVTNGAAQWQAVIIFAPYWNTVTNTGEIRRYVATGAPAAYFTVGLPVNITVNATNIVLDGVNVPRNGTRVEQEHQVGYMTFCDRVDNLTLAQGASPATYDVDLRCRGNLQKVILMDMGTGSRGRN